MPKFRKKPVVIEAVQFFDDPTNLNKLPDGVCVCSKVEHGLEYRPHIHTLEGAHIISNGDWLVTGVKGELYPCKPDIFEATYEIVTD